MYVLGLDTTGAHCSAAVVDHAKCWASRSEKIGRGHAERLAPMVMEVLQEAKLKPEDIARIAVCAGPGSFTGLRVALSYAKGFALPRRLPVLGFSSLEVFAREQDPEGQAPLTAYTDVRRGEYCVQSFGPKTAPRTLNHDDFNPKGALEFSGAISVPVMAWLAIDVAPENYPPRALYSRPPDAKLPGGVDPK